MNTAQWLTLISAILPDAEAVASIFIHNPASQHQFSVIVGTVNSLAPVVAGLSSALNAKGAAAAAAPPTTPTAEVIPAGVPFAHPAD